MDKLVKDYIKTHDIKKARFDLQVESLFAAFMLSFGAILVLNVKEGVEAHLMSGTLMIIGFLIVGFAKERSQKVIKV